MPNNMEGRGLTDREMLQLCLELEKGRCRSITNAMVETSHQALRAIYQKCYETSSSNQSELFRVLNEKGWYKTKQATVEEMEGVQRFMQNNLHPDDQF